MKERPILFSAPMVRALLAGTKTQTRRIVNPQPEMNGRWMEWCNGKGVLITEQNTAWHPFDEGFRRAISEYPHFCPYGQPGDRLWVREAWKAHSTFDHMPPRDIPKTRVWYAADSGYMPGSRSRPGIHMPRWVSRITLEIVSVRVERLQDISEADAQAEGCALECMTPTGNDSGSAIYSPGGYRDLWESINGPGAWEANPWVWCVSFRRIDAS